MQVALPEGVRLASLMNLAVNVVPISLSVLYVIYRSRPRACRREKAQQRTADASTRQRSSLRRDALIIVLLVGNVAAASLAAAAWHIVVDGHSLCLYIACALAGSTGSLASVALMPWVSRHGAELIPAVNTGGAASMLLLALIDVAEGPGEANPRFGVSTFFAVCAGLCVAPLLAYAVIHCRGSRGALPPPPGACGKPVAPEIALHRLRPDASSAEGSGGTPAKPVPPAADGRLSAEGEEAASGVEVVVLEDLGTHHAGGEGGSASAAPATPTSRRRVDAVPQRSVLHYCALNFVVNFVCWGMQPALIPLAVRHATAADAAEGPALQACTMASAVCVTLGHASSSRFRTRRLNLLTLVYLALALLFFLASVDEWGYWRSTGGTVLVVALVSCSRFADGLFTSLLSLEICAALDGALRAKRKEHVLRVVGLAGSIGTLLGSVVASALLGVLPEEAQT